jgi:hypothetical protein
MPIQPEIRMLAAMAAALGPVLAPPAGAQDADDRASVSPGAWKSADTSRATRFLSL